MRILCHGFNRKTTNFFNSAATYDGTRATKERRVPEVIAFLTENFALGWSGNRFPLVKVEKVRFLICEDSNYQLPKDIQDFNILDFCKQFCSMTEQEDDNFLK